jgi:hypothetical protein
MPSRRKPPICSAFRAQATASVGFIPRTSRTSSSPHPSNCRSSRQRSSSRRASDRPRQPRQPSPTACARPLRSRSSTSSPQPLGGDPRADRPQSRRKPRSYQVTLDGLGRRRRHNARKSAQATFGNGVSRRRPEAASLTGRHRPRMTLSAGMSLEECADMGKGTRPHLEAIQTLTFDDQCGQPPTAALSDGRRRLQGLH